MRVQDRLFAWLCLAHWLASNSFNLGDRRMSEGKAKYRAEVVDSGWMDGRLRREENK